MIFGGQEISELAAQIIEHEGVVPHAYKDSVGKTTIGIGRNIDDKPLTESEMLYLLRNDIADAKRDASRIVGPVFYKLSKVRQNVLIDMAFNLGAVRFAGFKKMLAYVRRGYYELAAFEMKNSKWYKQVGRRGRRLMELMKKG